MRGLPRRDLFFILACLVGLTLVWVFGISSSFAERKDIREGLSKSLTEDKLRKDFQKLKGRLGGATYVFKNDGEASLEISRLISGKNIRLDREVLESGERSDRRILQSQYSGNIKDLFDLLTELESHPRSFYLIEATLDRTGDSGRLRIRLQERLSGGAKS